jgi:hypothetical protein
MAITWQNVNAPSVGDPNRSMQGVQQSIGDIFSGLKEQLGAYRTNQDQNWQTGKENNTEAFLSALNSRYKTPEALAAAQASGELDAFKSSFGAQIDKAKTREAQDNRMGVLQQRGLAGIVYKDKVEEDALGPIHQQAKALIAANDVVGLAKLNEANPAYMKRYGGAAQLEMTQRQETAGRYSMDMLKSKSAIEHERALEAAARDQARAALIGADAQTVHSNAQALNAKTGAARLDFESHQALQKQLGDLNTSLATIGAPLTSPEGTKYVEETVGKLIPAGEDRDKVMAAITRVAGSKDPLLAGATPSAIVQAALGSVSTRWGALKMISNPTGDATEANLRAIMATDAYKAGVVRQGAQIQNVGAMRAQLMSDLYPGRATSGEPAAPGSGTPVSAPGNASPAPAPVVAPAAVAAPATTGPAALQPADIAKAFSAKGNFDWKDYFLNKEFPNGKPGTRSAVENRTRYADMEKQLDARLQELRDAGAFKLGARIDLPAPTDEKKK